MSKENRLDEIAEGIADVTMELMHDSIDWKIADFNQDGDEYNAIHSEVMILAIKKMWRKVYCGKDPKLTIKNQLKPN